MTDDLLNIPSKVNLEQFDSGVLAKEKIRELFRAGKLPTPEILVEEILLRAVKSGASDIHFEPGEHELRIRLGHEGVLKHLVHLPKELADNLANIIKTRAGLNTIEKKKSQEGRFSVTFGTHQYDVRVCTIPVMTGERAALHLLDKTARVASVHELGFSKDNLERFRWILRRPSGLILATGPSGSGRTTTINAAVSEIQSPEKNVITVENPVEYKLDFASQVQVSPDKSFTFADAFRSILRQSPNVIMLSEIRDAESGIIATEAAATGNLILTTMLSGDAFGAIPRLQNFGVTPYWLASALVGIVYQQLVRRICDACKEEYQPSTEEITVLSSLVPSVTKFYRGKGCAACKNSGYSGLTSIQEIVVVDDPLRDLIYQQATVLKMREAAASSGFESVKLDAAKKVMAGVVSLDEFVRALG
jgi:type II secretory ATPase GspE/PulE/Tfp pilus assembly ATPase PilB-like protein